MLIGNTALLIEIQTYYSLSAYF